jgi:hypothetical protein
MPEHTPGIQSGGFHSHLMSVRSNFLQSEEVQRSVYSLGVLRKNTGLDSPLSGQVLTSESIDDGTES